MRVAESTALNDLVGDNLKTHDALTGTSNVQGDYIGLYFSASWCGPCQRWTPKLAKFYQDFMQKPGNAGKLEIIFVSADKTEEEAQKYYTEKMPWLMLPFAERERQAQLASMYGVSTIPHLAIIDRTSGKLITSAGRDAVDADPEGNNFPWHPPSVTELAAGPVHNSAGAKSDFATVAKGKVTGLYFSAHWCPPCKKYTPQLADFYKKMKGTAREFEVVFVSRDKSREEFEQYLGSMPWWAFDFDRPENAKLASLCQVQTIPCLVLLDESGNVITTKAADLHRADPSGSEFPYLPKAIHKLTPAAGPTINSMPCIIAFVDAAGDDTALQKADDVLQASAETEFKRGAGRSINFYTADAGDEFSQQIMQVFGVDKAQLPQLVATRLPRFAVKALPAGQAGIQRTVDDLKADKLNMQELQA